MAASNRPTVEQSKRILAILGEVKWSLDMFLNPEDENCSIPADVRRAADEHGFMSTWVKSPLDDAIKRLECALEGRPYTVFED